jgi:hypothetical protein
VKVGRWDSTALSLVEDGFIKFGENQTESHRVGVSVQAMTRHVNGRRRTSRRQRGGYGQVDGPGLLPDPLSDVVDYGGALILAVGCTPGGTPFGPCVEIVDGELRFPDEEHLDPRAES